MKLNKQEREIEALYASHALDLRRPEKAMLKQLKASGSERGKCRIMIRDGPASFQQNYPLGTRFNNRSEF